MTFIFWQNIISIHQKDFLEGLVMQPSVSKVVLVVEHELTPVRKAMGWETPVMKGIELVLSPGTEKIKELIKNEKEAIHVFGGIRIGYMITIAFDECIKHKCRIGVMTEPYNSAGFKGMLRDIKYRYYAAKYFRHIQFVLAIGKEGTGQYSTLGYDTNRLFAWGYFINIAQQKKVHRLAADDEIRIIYAGRLEESKGICRFVEEMINTGKKNFKLDIYGSGHDEEKLKQMITENGFANQVSFTRFIKYNELLTKYVLYDWVVLPSTQKDGWGVIISEGLLNGLKGICSSICGVSMVIKEGMNGVVFDWSEKGSCKSAILKMLDGKGFADSERISALARETISGEAGAKYFLQITDCVYNGKERPVIPFLID